MLCLCLGLCLAGSQQDLFDASKSGDLDGVTQALSDGAVVDSVDADGNTALHWASWKGYHAVVKFLLESGAAIDKTDGRPSNTALMKAAYNGKFKAVKALLKAGANIELKNGHGTTSLMNAAAQGHYRVVDALLRNSADVHARDQGGVTAIHKAAWKGHNKIIERLIEAGADVNEKRDDEVTPIMLAMGQHHSTVELLQKHGAELPEMKRVDPSIMNAGKKILEARKGGTSGNRLEL